MRGRYGVRIGLMLTVIAAVGAPAPVAAQEVDSLAREVEALTRRMNELELELAEQQAEMQAQAEAAMRTEERAAVAARGEVPDPRQRMVSGIYGRPFVWRGGGAAVGGYVDIEYQGSLEEEGPQQFIAHRMIPFIFAEITDRIHFGTELEFEYGGEEIKVEFAALDVAFADAAAFRGGLLLSPLGKFNLIHDSPINDLTRRPIVDQSIMPTTLTEAGLGVFGTLYPSEQSVVTYEAYVVNGFHDGLLVNGDALRSSPRIRSGRGNLRTDNNRAKSFVGRLGYSPFLGMELGVSGHTGVYSSEGVTVEYADNAGTTGPVTFDGDERATIAALDGILTRGPFELLGEVGYTMVDLPEAGTGGPAELSVAEQVNQLGYYLQGNFHFGHGLIGMFPSSLFTAVARWDDVDLDLDVNGDDTSRMSLGLNWRPVEETVFKLSLERDWATGRLVEETPDGTDALWFSVASYF